jgi:hypothetical protein
MLRLLANENFPGPVIARLRELGHDVVAVKETMRGADDAPRSSTPLNRKSGSSSPSTKTLAPWRFVRDSQRRAA